MLKVVQLQYATASGGSSAFRLQKAFLEAGISSSIISLLADIPRLENILYLGKRERFVARIACKIESLLTRKMKKKPGIS